MKLAAIYIAWSDCTDLLWKSVKNTLPAVDRIYVVWSNRSNRGETIPFHILSLDVVPLQIEPFLHYGPQQNETMKRNAGIDQARKDGFTHFLMMDSDEFYLRQDILRDRDRMDREDINGLVCGLRVYIKEPTLWCEDHTLVPFITKLTPDVSIGDHRHFPFAYDKLGNCHIDPTRRPSHVSKIGWTDTVMHHFSYVRKDMDLKIRNSTANLGRSRDVIFKDLAGAKPGYKSLLYHRELQETEDIFGINEKN